MLILVMRVCWNGIRYASFVQLGTLVFEKASGGFLAFSRNTVVRFDGNGKRDTRFSEITVTSPLIGVPSVARIYQIFELSDGALIVYWSYTYGTKILQDGPDVLEKHLPDGSIDFAFGTNRSGQVEVRGPNLPEPVVKLLPGDYLARDAGGNINFVRASTGLYDANATMNAELFQALQKPPYALSLRTDRAHLWCR